MQDASTFVSSASKKEVVEKLEKAQAQESRLSRVERTAKEKALAIAGMGAEVAGSMLGGVAVGYMRANGHEDWMSLASVGLGAVAGMKRLEDPKNQVYQVAFATANGIGAAVVADYAYDYFKQGQGQQQST